MSETSHAAGTLETPADAGKGGAGLVSLWLDAIALADREEKTWRERGEQVIRIYRDDESAGVTTEAAGRRKFNILYSNTETIAPAVYNSTPVPDVRRRFRDPDPVGRVAAQVLERCLSYSIDVYGFDARMEAAVKDTLLPGRGVVRVRYEPEIGEDGTITREVVRCDAVEWKSFRRGPARFWDDVPWVAFEHFLTRGEFEKINKRIGATIDLDCTVDDRRDQSGRDHPPPDMFKRGRCWEVWDKEAKKVLFIAPAYKEGPVAELDDPLNLRGFFPVPRPLYAVETPGNLIPIPVYRSYQGLAEDLEEVSRRIAALTRALKWRGAYLDPMMGNFLSQFEDLEDGGMIPLENPAAALQGDLSKAFWFQPVEVLVNVLARLYESREQIKQAIYEITGISDIVRGASSAAETATAQQIKTQWGALRIQKMQREVQRFACDLLGMMAEIIAERFQPQAIMEMAGMSLPTQAQLAMAQQAGQQVPPDTVTVEKVIELLRNETLRDYRVDIETDSTIRADLSRDQQNIAQFVQGFGTFIQSVGPAVQAGFMPMPAAATLLKAFSRSFKLGRDAEDAIEDLGEVEPPQQPDPAQAEAAKAQAAAQQDQAKQQGEAQRQQQQLAAEQQAGQMKMMAERQAAQDKMQTDMAMEQVRQEAETQRESMRLFAEADRHREALAADVQKAQIAADASLMVAREKLAPAGRMPN